MHVRPSDENISGNRVTDTPPYPPPLPQFETLALIPYGTGISWEDSVHEVIFSFLLATLSTETANEGVAWTQVDTELVDIPATLAGLSKSENTVVYVGAKWCEPCKRFKSAAKAGKLDRALPGTRFVEFDLDRQRSSLEVAGYQSRMIPLFCLPDPDTGRNSGECIQGSVKGPGAIGNLVPRLQSLLGIARGPIRR